MSENTQWIVAGAPHIHGPESVKKMMWGVVIALIPAFLVSIYFFGLQALCVIGVSVASCILFEWLIQRFFFHKPLSIGDGSAVITGLLLAFNLPSNLPLGIVVIGALVAIGIAKMAYGGLGNNPFNPALVGRAFLLISFPVAMTTWPLIHPLLGEQIVTDAITGPTPLSFAKESLKMGIPVQEIMTQIGSYSQMAMGQKGGSLGELSAIAILLGGLYMLFRKIISWHIPVSFLGSAFLFATILWWTDPSTYFPPVFVLLSGGLMLGAIFMATDLVTSPITPWGKIVFGIGCGVLTILIRVFGSYPEGVSFAILIMNAFVPLINKGFSPKRYGY
ncbi:MAG: RnfABCDGE type electron transport complex subunit D [Bacteroidales bacterium]